METTKYAIVLDTNPFGDKNKYNFKKSRIAICANSFKDISNMTLFIPNIVVEELKKHIKESIELSVSKIESIYLKQYLTKDHLEKAYKEKEKELNTFIKKNRIEIIDCEKYLNMEEVNKWYFKTEKPFEKSKPKEFPDAMILSAIKNYFNDSDYNKIIVITDDGGFKDGIYEKTKYEVSDDIGHIMKKLLDISEAEIRNIDKYLSKNPELLEDLDSYIIESLSIDDDIEVDKITFEKDNIEILGKEKNSYTVCVNGKIIIDGVFSIIDTDLSVFDSEDPECSALFWCYGKRIEIDSINLYIDIITDDENKIVDQEIIDKAIININEYINQLNQDDGTIYNYI